MIFFLKIPNINTGRVWKFQKNTIIEHMIATYLPTHVPTKNPKMGVFLIHQNIPYN